MVYLEKDVWRGGLIFVAFNAGVNVLMFPGAVLSLTAGAIFGLYAGSALAVTGTILGQTLTFCVGRCALQPIQQMLHEFCRALHRKRLVMHVQVPIFVQVGQASQEVQTMHLQPCCVC